MLLCLVVIFGALDLAYATSNTAVGGSTFKERLQSRSKQFNDTWLNAPRKRHTDSDTSGARQAAFKKECQTFNGTWLNAPRKRHTDSDTSGARQAAFKKRCRTFNETWLNAPQKRHTDSSPYEVASASKKIK